MTDEHIVYEIIPSLRSPDERREIGRFADELQADSFARTYTQVTGRRTQPNDWLQFHYAGRRISGYRLTGEVVCAACGLERAGDDSATIVQQARSGALRLIYAQDGQGLSCAACGQPLMANVSGGY